jgi:hypothetical protein
MVQISNGVQSANETLAPERKKYDGTPLPKIYLLAAAMSKGVVEFRDEFFESVRSILEQARKKTAVHINSTMFETYWRIGRYFMEEEQGGSVRDGYMDMVLIHPPIGEYGTFETNRHVLSWGRWRY